MFQRLNSYPYFFDLLTWNLRINFFALKKFWNDMELAKISISQGVKSFVMARFIFLMMASMGPGCKGPGSPQPAKPNIIIVLADDLGWSDVGYNGNRWMETPNLDRLAKEGLVAERFYPSAANCAPSRASLLTGMYAPRHGVYVPQGFSRGGDVNAMRWKVPTHGQDSSFFTFPVSINHVNPEFESLAEMLKRAGYISARFGKWHIGDDNQGFDVSSADGTSGLVTNLEGEEQRFYNDTTVAERLTGAAVHFMEKNRNSPFFLYLSHWEVHSPMAARKQRIAYYAGKFSGKGDETPDPVYAAETEQLDLSLGRIMEALEKLDLVNNTLLIFTSDNGGSLSYTTNIPLKAGKGTFYEGGIRTPFVARWPGVIQPETSLTEPISGIDFMPTFAEIAGADLPSGQPVDGVSMLPHFKGSGNLPERSLFFHFPLYLGGEGEKSRVLPDFRGNPHQWRAVPSTTMIRGEWKLIWYYEYDNHELYHLGNDPSETHNLAGTQPELENDLLEELRQWVKKVNAPVPEVLNQ